MDYRDSKANGSKRSCPITIRLKNEHLDVITAMVELGDFETRNEAVVAMLYPSLVQFAVAMETKSLVRAVAARVKAEKQLQERVRTVAGNAEIQDKLDLDVDGLSFEML